MTINRDTIVLFDGACLVAAAGSPTGGSGFLLRLCSRGYLTAAASLSILAEADKNVRGKLGDLAALRYERLLNSVDLLRVRGSGRPVPAVVNEKDRHVLAAALDAHANLILTLDRPFASEVAASGVGVTAVTPAQFIHTELPTHPDFPFAHH